MPAPKPLPRKYLGLLEDAKSELSAIGNQAKAVVASLDMPPHNRLELKHRLQEIEVRALRTACDLNQIQLADTCDECPLSPVQPNLVSLSDVLELARRMAAEDIPPERRVPSLN